MSFVDVMPSVGVIGVGSIGSVLARGFSELGHDVVINDRDETTISKLPFPERSKAHIAANCDLAVVAVPTPTTEQGGDASAVDAVLSEMHGATATVVLRSTMPPGTTQRLADTYGLPLVYSPEFLRDRSGVDDFFHPDRIVLAGPESERDVVRGVMDVPDIGCETFIETDDYLTAEVAKEAHNAFFATKVSFANQMRLIADASGCDVQTVMDVVTADSRNTDSHLDPLLGPYGGKCLPKDTEALTHYASEADAPTPLLEGVIRLNDHAKETYENVDIKGNWPHISITSD